MAAKHLNLPPVSSTVASFTLSNAPPLPTTPTRWWRRPSTSRSSLARDNDDGSDVHRCSCRRVVVVLVVMLVVVLSLSVVPSRRCCHRRRCHRQTTNAKRPSPSPWPPLSPLLSQWHSLQLSPLPSPRCRLHRHCRLGNRPRRRIDDANSLNAAIAGFRHFRGNRRRCRRCRRIRYSHCRRHCPQPPLSPPPQPPLTSPPALVWSSPDAWACGDDSPSRRAWWRGLEI
jgi:hypothetical protein